MTAQGPGYPALYEAADNTSLTAQRRYLRFSAVRLLALVGAAGMMLLTALIGWWAPAAAVAFLFAALTCEMLLLTLRPERQWYDGRAVAESAKTLAWRYQVGGDPFGLDVPEKDAAAELLKRLQQIRAEFPGLDLLPAEGNQVTEAMRQVRGKPLADRRAVYRQGRIENQLVWYREESKWNGTRALRWQVSLVVLEIAAILGAVLRATDLLPIDAYGFLAAVAVAAVGWLQIKQHQGLARGYSVASHDLASINSQLDAVGDEDGWKRFVDQAEKAISREHTSWRASRSS